MVRGIMVCLPFALFITMPQTVLAFNNHNNSANLLKVCKLCGLVCSDSDVIYDIIENGKHKKLLSISNSDTGSKYISYQLFLCEAQKSSHVLHTDSTGSIDFLPRKDSPYPDISAHASMSANSAIYYFFSWNGNKYIPATEKVAAAMNKEALHLLKNGDISKAVDILQVTAQSEKENAEFMNNLGYALYLLAKKEKSDLYFKDARNWLEKSLEADPSRWSVYLNLGDLFFDSNDIMYAVKHYRKLLEIKPDYKFTKKLKDRVDQLILRPSKPGEILSVTSTDSGMSNVTYTRLEDGRVVRKEYFEGGKPYAVHYLKDGYADGEYIAYWSYLGGIRVKGQFSKGMRNGKFIYYNEQEKVVKEIIYNSSNTSSKLEEECRDY